MCQQCPRTYLPAGNNTKITSLWSFLSESERCNMCTTFIYCFISQGINSHLNQFLHRTNFTRQVYDLGQIQQLPLLSKLPFLGLCVRGSRHTEILLPIKIHYFELTVTKKNRKNTICVHEHDRLHCCSPWHRHLGVHAPPACTGSDDRTSLDFHGWGIIAVQRIKKFKLCVIAPANCHYIY